MEHLSEYKHNKWFHFWQNLKEGYDIFEKTHIPPIVNVKNNRYVLESINNISPIS